MDSSEAVEANKLLTLKVTPLAATRPESSRAFCHSDAYESGIVFTQAHLEATAHGTVAANVSAHLVKKLERPSPHLFLDHLQEIQGLLPEVALLAHSEHLGASFVSHLGTRTELYRKTLGVVAIRASCQSARLKSLAFLTTSHLSSKHPAAIARQHAHGAAMARHLGIQGLCSTPRVASGGQERKVMLR